MIFKGINKAVMSFKGNRTLSLRSDVGEAINAQQALIKR
jgi:hypothetical protein